MSCDVAVLPFQAHTNYGTWLIDFEQILLCLWNPPISMTSIRVFNYMIKNLLFISIFLCLLVPLVKEINNINFEADFVWRM